MVDAFAWAQVLLSNSDIKISHESGIDEGETLVVNKGDTELGMGQLYPAENMGLTRFSKCVSLCYPEFLKYFITTSHSSQILMRWVDQEETLGYPRNSHLTQV